MPKYPICQNSEDQNSHCHIDQYQNSQSDTITLAIMSRWLFWHWLFCHVGYFGIGYYGIGYYDLGYSDM